MPDDLVKLCPRCGSEYQMWVERCLDCGATLVHGIEGQGATVVRSEGLAAEGPPTIPPDAILLRNAPPDWIGRLSEDLDEAGIGHWVSAPEWQKDPRVFVLPSDVEEARAIDRERYALEMPEVSGEARPRRTVRPQRREPSADDLEIKVCPSCGAEYQLWAETCADCGVPLVRPWDLGSARESAPRTAVPVASLPPDLADPGACPACGERLPDGAAECPGCGLMLSQPDACPNCGVELEPFVASCRQCGYELFGSAEG